MSLFEIFISFFIKLGIILERWNINDVLQLQKETWYFKCGLDFIQLVYFFLYFTVQSKSLMFLEQNVPPKILKNMWKMNRIFNKSFYKMLFHLIFSNKTKIYQMLWWSNLHSGHSLEATHVHCYGELRVKKTLLKIFFLGY